MSEMKSDKSGPLSTPRTPPTFTFSIRNFGPIISGSVPVRPLTILVGPNNSGKSYTAMLLHAIMSSYARSKTAWRRAPRWRRRRVPTVQMAASVQNALDELTPLVAGLKSGDTRVVPPELSTRLCKLSVDSLVRESLGEQVTRLFTAPLHDLARYRGRGGMSLGIFAGDRRVSCRRSGDSFTIVDYPRCLPSVALEVTDTTEYASDVKTVATPDGFRVVKSMPSFRREMHDYEVSQILEAVSAGCAEYMLAGLERPSRYLPAARSGILQAHKLLASQMWELAPQIGLREFEIPKFSGVVTDFMATLLRLSTNQTTGPYFALASELEERLVGGKITMLDASEATYPEIVYALPGMELPLHRSASTVSEFAALSLYLKYVVTDNSLLLIEEPETHLHPENQRVLAEYIVLLIRRGLHVVITTHSDFLIEQLNNFILLKGIPNDVRRSKYQLHENAYLDAGEVSALVFTRHGGTRGFTVKSLAVTPDEGISQSEFMRVHEALYEQTLRLRRDAVKDTE